MKCFYHTDTDAVGTCSQCGKTACRACIEDIRGVLLCKGCMALKLEARELRKEATEAHLQAARERARRKIRASKIVLIVIAAFGCVIGIAMAFASLSDPNAPPLIAFVPGVPLGAALSGYFVWALYWGIPAIWKRWWGALKGTGLK